jgi:hypothetical protein
MYKPPIANEKFQGYWIPVLPYFFFKPRHIFNATGGAMF